MYCGKAYVICVVFKQRTAYGMRISDWSSDVCSSDLVFVEVRVDEDLGTIKVSRVVSAIAAGRIVNPKTAGNQIVGGVVWGIGQALQIGRAPWRERVCQCV